MRSPHGARTRTREEDWIGWDVAIGRVPKVQKKGLNSNVPEGEGRGPAAQLIDILPCAHLNVCRAQDALVADRGLIWYQYHPAHRAMQRMVTLRPSGPVEPCL